MRRARALLLGALASAALAAGATARGDDGLDAAAAGGAGDGAATREIVVDARRFQVAKGQSGPVSYYEVVTGEPGGAYLRGRYRPPLESVVMAIEIPKHLRQRIVRLRWRWRATAMPQGGNECDDKRKDTAASVYVVFKRALRWYSLKYVWSDGSPQGTVCAKRRWPLSAQDSVILRSSGVSSEWVEEDIDPVQAFRDHFAGGDPRAEVPDLVGVGVMTDGDDTKSESGADWSGFRLVVKPAER